MPEKIVDKEGKEIEVLTDEEVEALIGEEKEKAVASAKEEAEKEFQEKLAEKEKEVEEMRLRLSAAEETLEKSGEGTKDWAAARAQIKKLETELQNLSKERDVLKEEFSQEVRNIRTSIFKSQIDSMIGALAEGDDELKKKIEYHYNRLGGNVDNEQEARETLKDAYLLATGKFAPDPLSVVRGTFSGEAPKTKEPSSQEVIELGKKFGVSDEDIEKYSQKAKQKKQI